MFPGSERAEQSCHVRWSNCTGHTEGLESTLKRSVCVCYAGRRSQGRQPHAAGHGGTREHDCISLTGEAKGAALVSFK